MHTDSKTMCVLKIYSKYAGFNSYGTIISHCVGGSNVLVVTINMLQHLGLCIPFDV